MNKYKYPTIERGRVKTKKIRDKKEKKTPKRMEI